MLEYPYVEKRYSVRGVNATPPSPQPVIINAMARVRLNSKYCGTMTDKGTTSMLAPTPVNSVDIYETFFLKEDLCVFLFNKK